MIKILFIELLQGILHETIDEVHSKVMELDEEDLTARATPAELDLAAFDFLISTLEDMKRRYGEYKLDVEGDPNRQAKIEYLFDDEDDNEGPIQ